MLAKPRQVDILVNEVHEVNGYTKLKFTQLRPALEHAEMDYDIRGNDTLVSRLQNLVDQKTTVTVAVGRLKDPYRDRVYTDDGQIGSYWWVVAGLPGDTIVDASVASPAPVDNLDDLDDVYQVFSDPTPADNTGHQDPTPRQILEKRMGAGDSNPPPPNPAALGACHNHAVDFIVRGILPVPDGRELFGWVRELRDRFYREINQAPVMPLHYCYAHDQERRQGPTGGWGHLLPKEAEGDEKSYCIEGQELWRVFDASMDR